MDGASKFVKGDAIAVFYFACQHYRRLDNWIGSARFTDWQAAEAYILLSIGDGLVAQIPHYYYQ